MSKKLTARNRSYVNLEGLVGHDMVVDVWRERFDPYPILGFPVGLSARILLLHLVDKNSLALNGYAAVRLRDITGWSIDQSFVPRTLRLLERRPVPCEGIALDDWASLITWVRSRYPLIAVQSEKKDPDAAYFGRVVEQKKRGIVLRELDGKARWRDKTYTHAYSGITQVEFESGYIQALAAIAEHEGTLPALPLPAH